MPAAAKATAFANPMLQNAAAFLARLVAEFPQKIDAVTTDIRPAFAHLREAFGEGKPAIRPHPFAVACSAKGIVHKRTLLISREPVSAETAQTNAAAIR